MMATHLDIIYVASLLKKFMHKPCKAHWDDTSRVIVFIKQSLGEWLVYRQHIYLHIEAYSNSEYPGDKGDKLTIGYRTHVKTSQWHF